MGNTIASGMKETMDENMKKQQEFMIASQRMVMERQMVMQQQMQSRMMSMQLARARDMFHWVSAFVGTATFFLLIGAIKSKKPGLLGPLLPLGFITGYQYDLAYGDKLIRIREDAEWLMKEHQDLIQLPYGPVTFEEVEEIRTTKCAF